ncbi:MAG: YwaF family protein [Clostridia bacterium]|nr:YwaF family protein [Clostridia bacterium]
MNSTSKNSKQMPLYLLTLIIFAAAALIVFVATLITGAVVEGEMTAFEKLIHLLDTKMEIPPLYGTWHIVFVVLTLALTVFLVATFKDCSDQTLRRILLVLWLVILFFEIYKQVVYAFGSDGVTATWKYDWHVFPFQFCSTPLYLLPIIIFAKEGKFRNAIVAYMVTFSLFAGLIVMVYPGDVFSFTVGINIQTMIHHGTQLAIGVFLVAHNRHHLNKRFFAWSMIVFSVFASLALLMNTIAHYQMPGVEFNMFFISPFQPCTLPVLSAIYPLVPYPVYLIMYVLGFALVSALVYTIEKCIVSICSRIKHRGEN